MFPCKFEGDKKGFSFVVCLVVLMLKLQTLDTHRCVCVWDSLFNTGCSSDKRTGPADWLPLWLTRCQWCCRLYGHRVLMYIVCNWLHLVQLQMQLETMKAAWEHKNSLINATANNMEYPHTPTHTHTCQRSIQLHSWSLLLFNHPASIYFLQFTENPVSLHE